MEKERKSKKMCAYYYAQATEHSLPLHVIMHCGDAFVIENLHERNGKNN